MPEKANIAKNRSTEILAKYAIKYVRVRLLFKVKKISLDSLAKMMALKDGARIIPITYLGKMSLLILENQLLRITKEEVL